MAPYPRITCYPPLSQLTILPTDGNTVYFTVVIEWSKSRPDFPFEVCILYDNSSGSKHFSQYSCLQLRSIQPQPYLFGTQDTDNYRATFGESLILEAPGLYFFSVKYRVDQYAPWQFVNTELGTGRGELILQQSLDPGMQISSVLTLESGWNVNRIGSGTCTLLCSMRSDKTIPKGGEKSRIVVGKVQKQYRYFSLVRRDPYWIGPRQGEDFFHLSEDSFLCSFIIESGVILSIMALSGVGHVVSVIQSDDGRVVVAAQNDGETDSPFQLFCAVGETVEDTIKAVVTEARRSVEQTESIGILAAEAQPFLETDYSSKDFFDGLVFCTWNALGQDLSATKVLGALDALAANNISITTLLIDDNWQTLGNTRYDYSDSFMRGFADFSANQAGFPTGLNGLIAEIRQKHPNIQDIGVWHALFGYWAGLASNSPLTKKYKTRQINTRLMGNIPSVIDIVDPEDAPKFYNDFYQFLAESGVTFVKTDVQHMLGQLTSSNDRRSIPAVYQRAWTIAYLRHFQGKAISCMSQIPQTMLHSLLAKRTSQIVMRNSDDFYPEVPASHPWHVWTNAHNALFTQHLNVLPDWDMFQTSHDFSAYHAASRCVSGGPISITDCPGEHDINLIHQITARSPDGRTIALRPNVGKSMRVFDKYTNGNALQIGTTTGETSILGMFNTGERDISLLVSPTNFPNLDSQTILIRSFHTKQIHGPITLDQKSGPQDLIQLHLPVRGWDILASHHVHNLHGREVAVLGLLGHMCGSAALVSSQIESNGDVIQIQAKLKALGNLGIWIGGSISSDMIKVSLQAEPIDWKLEKTAMYSLLHIDILEAWENMGARDKKLREVQVDINISPKDQEA